MTLSVWGLVVIILVTLGIVVAILVFERPRARRIEEDLRRQATRDPEQDT
jgi:hypothetical protein